MGGGSVASSAHLAGEFYSDAETIQDALRQGRPFNVIHFASGYKFDHFEVQLERSTVQDVSLGKRERMRCSLATAEDMILAKLAWYRAGGEHSERHYLREWARHLNVADLLVRIFSEEDRA